MSGKNKKISTKAIFTEINKLFKINNIDINKILVSKREPFGKKSSFKYYIGYDDNDDIRT